MKVWAMAKMPLGGVAGGMGGGICITVYIYKDGWNESVGDG